MDSDHVCEVWYDGRKIGVATNGKMVDAMLEAERQRIRREESEKSWSERDWGHDWDRRNRRCRRCQMGETDFEDQRPKRPCQRHMEKSDPKVILVSLSQNETKDLKISFDERFLAKMEAMHGKAEGLTKMGGGNTEG